jgi:hypothetical protein
LAAPIPKPPIEGTEMSEQLVASSGAGGTEQSGLDHEQGDNMLVGRSGRSPCRVVIEAKIPSKPHETGSPARTSHRTSHRTSMSASLAVATSHVQVSPLVSVEDSPIGWRAVVRDIQTST